ncbi:MAG: hypothetical protein E7357_06310, partial [Clostridiales bacterium]|nr:hypothetical protein [Clostridiales bacterium]
MLDIFLATIWARESPPYDDPSDYPEYPDYQSAYTEEEHIERISEIVAAQEWTWMYGARIAAYEVETVYAFSDNDPEFFLIDLKFQDAFETLSITHKQIETDEGFMLGYIVDDEYYIVVEGNGDNPWEYAGYADAKKYFGSYIYAVETDGVMLEIGRDDHPDETYISCEVFFETREMSQAEQIAAMDYEYLKEEFKRDTEYDTYTTWRCEYKEHENLNRLSLLTENGAWKNEEYIPSSLGDLVDFDVEIVYAFYDYTPQFFLIDLTFENMVELTSAQGVTETTNHAYILGRIDEYGYYYTLMISVGCNPWEYAGYGKKQKYYGQFHYA